MTNSQPESYSILPKMIRNSNSDYDTDLIVRIAGQLFLMAVFPMWTASDCSQVFTTVHYSFWKVNLMGSFFSFTCAVMNFEISLYKNTTVPFKPSLIVGKWCYCFVTMVNINIDLESNLIYKMEWLHLGNKTSLNNKQSNSIYIHTQKKSVVSKWFSDYVNH
jgi:hypothetical protein